MRRNNSLFIWVTMLLSIMNTNVFAFDMMVKNVDGVTIYYNYINDKTELEVTYLYNSYLGIGPIGPRPSNYKGTVNIPEEVTYEDKTLRVTRIGKYAFVDCNDALTVNIPNSVTTIDDCAFVGSNIASISIPNSVTEIGLKAFSGCLNLYSLSIPPSLKHIGTSAFANCNHLSKVTIKDLAAWCKIGFADATANPLYSAYHLYLDDMEITELVIPKEITTIGRFAFSHFRGLTSLTLSNDVSIIGDYAFDYCINLTSLTIENSVTTIGKNAFAGCTGLTSLTVGDGVTTIGDSAFAFCSGIASLNIGNNVAIIGNSVFSGCSGLTTVTIPQSVRSIGNSTFRNCRGITSLNIGENVESLGNYAFEGCDGLTSVILPNSVATIGERAFYGCTSLLYVSIPNSVTGIKYGAFAECDNLVAVVSQIENPFFINGKSMSSVLQTFSENAFKYATLYVPYRTKERYMATTGWNDFLFIQEGTGGDVTDISNPQRCENPTISYDHGRLAFDCATEGATCQYSITDKDIKSGSGNEILLSVTYDISVFATKQGCYNSDVVNATLCWIDVDPKMEGIDNDVANVKALPVLIQSKDGEIWVTGAPEGVHIHVFNTSGQMVGSAQVTAADTTVSTTLQDGEVGILKIGEKTVKIRMK